MFELRIQRTFAAAHAIVMAGVREPMHGHNWEVTVAVCGEALDADGLLCDFHLLEGAVDETIRPFMSRCLNETPPFDRDNPTAELVAQHIANKVSAHLPVGVRVKEVRVVEAPQCEACFVVPTNVTHNFSQDRASDKTRNISSDARVLQPGVIQ
ncbi:MAG: 6-pyruvoyl tetrahydropterin synthase family protein [Phycisphaerales bacterium]|nr:6-pyruvoyl tetrahydropterin synthase family protein [Phycisphaerales bacterium]